MPKAVDSCVKKRLANPDFQAPETFDGDRESFAWALCKSLDKQGKLPAAGEFLYVMIEGSTYYSEDQVRWRKSRMVIEEATTEDIAVAQQKMNTLMGALTPGSIMKFRDAILVRAEVNKNKDEVDQRGIREIASSLALKPIDRRHNAQEIVGIFIEGQPIENDSAVSTSGLVWAGRWAEVAQDLLADKAMLSIEARAENAICAECGGVYAAEDEYCDHITRSRGGTAIRKLRGMVADGGAIVPNPAGTDTHIPSQGLLMIAHVGEDMEKTIDLWSESDEAAYFDGVSYEGKQLSYEQRQDLPDSAFALIQTKDGERRRRFPIHDCARARNALQRLPNAKQLSASERATVKRKAQAKLNSKECRAETKGGIHMELERQLEEAQAEILAKTEELEASQTEAAELERKLQEAKSKLQAAEAKVETTKAERDAVKEEREAMVKERDGLKEELDKLSLAARLDKVSPFVAAEELKEQEADIAGMTDSAFNLYVAAAEAASKTIRKHGQVFLMGEDDGATEVSWD